MLKGNGIHTVWFYVSAGLFSAGFILFLAAFSSSYWTLYPGEHGHFGVWEGEIFGEKTDTMNCLTNICPLFTVYKDKDRSSACPLVAINVSISVEECVALACVRNATVIDYSEEMNECHLKHCKRDQPSEELKYDLKLWQHTGWKVYTSLDQKINHVQAIQGLVIVCFVLVLLTLVMYILMFLGIMKESKSDGTELHLMRTKIKVLVGFQALAGVILGTVVMIHGLSNTKPAQSIGWSFIVAVVCALLFGMNGAAANFIRKPQWNNNIKKRPLTDADQLDEYDRRY